MTAKPRFVIAAIAAALAVAAPVMAHHGWGSYDASKPLTITGPIKHSTYQYPHAHVMIDHEGNTWEITLAPPSRMEARRAVLAVVKEGNVMAAYGYASTAKPHEMRAERITVDGKTYEMR
jgi:hypothetical protein